MNFILYYHEISPLFTALHAWTGNCVDRSGFYQKPRVYGCRILFRRGN